MINTLLGFKKNMSARFNQAGHRIPVTQIVAGPNIILQIEKNKAQLGFGQKKKVKKPQNAFVKTAGFAPRFIKEVQINKEENDQTPKSQYSAGNTINVSIFEPGDKVKVTGITKGKGFAGVVKRWGFAGGPKTHGQSDRHRAPGSIGQGTTPGRVYKGKKMAGHMGVSKLTVTGLEVVEVDSVNNLLIVKGSVPGAKNGFLQIEKTGKVKNFIPLFKKEAAQNIDEENITPKQEEQQNPRVSQNKDNQVSETNEKEEEKSNEEEENAKD